MPNYVTNTSQTRFGDIKLTWGSDDPPAIIDAEIQDGAIPLNYDYKIFDSDLSDEVTIVLSNESNINDALLNTLTGLFVTININGTDVFIGTMNKQSIVRDFKNETLRFIINSFDFDDNPYSAGTTGRITFNAFLADIFTQFGFTFTIQETGTSKYTLSDGTDVFIDSTEAGGGDQYIELAVFTLIEVSRIKEILLSLMIDLITINNVVHIVPKARTGITPQSIETFKEAYNRQEFYKTDDFSPNYKTSIMNYISTGKSTFYEAYSNERITAAVDKLNSYNSIATINTSNWTLSANALVTSGGYNYLFDLNGFRLLWPTTVTDAIVKPITFSLPTVDFDTISQGDTLLVNFHVWDTFAVDMSFKMSSSTEFEIPLPSGFNGNDGANFSFEYLVDADTTGDEIEIIATPNLQFLVDNGDGLFVTAVNYAGSTLTVTTQGDPTAIGVVIGSQMAVFDIGVGYDSYVWPNVSGVTSNSISFTIGLAQPTPSIQPNSSVFFRNAMFQYDTLTISDVAIGINRNMKDVPLTSVTSVSEAVQIYTNSASDADDVDLVHRIMDKVLDTASTTLGDVNNELIKRVNYSTKTDSLVPASRPAPYDVITENSVNHKQISHTLDLKTGRIDIEMTEL